MFRLKLFPCIVIICLSSTISTIKSQKYDQISTCEVKGQFWNGEAEAKFACAEKDNENDIFKDYPKYISNYLKSRIGSVQFIDCRFREIKRKYGLEFEHLHTFNISDIELETISENTFKGAKKLLKLNASKNRLKELPSRIFADAKQLNSIDFSNNFIQRIDPLAFEGATNLKTLNLSHNSINQLDFRVISLPNLSVLDLSLNSFGNLCAGNFANLSNLEHLILNRANINTIEMGTFSHQHKLISLDLSGNQLEQLNFNVFFPHLANLRSLSLHQNQLTELHCVTNSELSEFVILDLNENKFNCSYLKRLLDFVHWELIHRPASQSNSSVGQIEGITCVSTGKNESSQAYNDFVIEFCPDNKQSDQNKADNSFKIISFMKVALISIVIVILICFLGFLIKRRYQHKSAASFEVSDGILSSRPIVH